MVLVHLLTTPLTIDESHQALLKQLVFITREQVTDERRKGARNSKQSFGNRLSTGSQAHERCPLVWLRCCSALSQARDAQLLEPLHSPLGLPLGTKSPLRSQLLSRSA